MKWVYRVEDKNGLGPYRGEVSEHHWCDSLHIYRNHPDPQHDLKLRRKFIDKIPKRYQFGFSSIEQLESWFSSKELLRLHELGFDVYIVEVKKLDLGSHQVAFIRGKGREKIHMIDEVALKLSSWRRRKIKSDAIATLRAIQLSAA